MLDQLKGKLFGISPTETSVEERGFFVSSAHVRHRLEQVGDTFLHGYHAALEDPNLDRLDSRLNAVGSEFCGFAFEGAGMALCLLDHLMPWRRDRLQSFLDGPGSEQTYMIHVGVGWALARIPWRTRLPPTGYDPLLRWLALDGYGFHEGYFHWPRYLQEKELPVGFSGYALRAFDQGLGRSIWFVDGADMERIPHTIAGLPTARHPDLWSGIGLACAYAGGADGADLELLRAAAGSHQACLAQGVAFAAKTRQRAGNPTDHTDQACHVFWGLPPESVAALPDIALEDLPPDGTIPAYEVWRRRIQADFTWEEVPA